MFPFADLSPDIAMDVLAASAAARGLKRALRMRLVCKRFSELVLDAILETDLLDHFARSGYDRVSVDGRNRAHYGVFLDLWRAYLMRLALDRSLPATRVGVVLRECARRYCEEAGLVGADAHRSVIETLCDREVLPKTAALWLEPVNEAWTLGNLIEDSVLVAAARFNDVSTVRRLLAGRPDNRWPYVRSQFEDPSYVAALFGSRDVLPVFWEAWPSHRPYMKAQVRSGISARGSLEELRAVWPEYVFTGLRGDRSLLKDLTSGALGHMFHSGDPNMVELYYELGYKVKGLDSPPPLRETPGLENRFLTRRSGTDLGRVLYLTSRLGHISMLEFLLEIGVLHDDRGQEQMPLPAAAAGFQTAAVEWLLLNGADVNEGDALEEAVASGSLEIARILVANGADVRAGHRHPPIVQAVLLEHTSIIDLLKEHGALTMEARVKALTAARESGLESMVELLHSYG